VSRDLGTTIEPDNKLSVDLHSTATDFSIAPTGNPRRPTALVVSSATKTPTPASLSAGHHGLQAAILFLQGLQPLGVAHLEPTVLAPPAVEGFPADAALADYLVGLAAVLRPDNPNAL